MGSEQLLSQIEDWYNSRLLTFIRDNSNGVTKEDLIIQQRRKEFGFNYTDLEKLIELGKITEKDEKYFYKMR